MTLLETLIAARESLTGYVYLGPDLTAAIATVEKLEAMAKQWAERSQLPIPEHVGLGIPVDPETKALIDEVMSYFITGAARELSRVLNGDAL